jgi:hypothetical protein
LKKILSVADVGRQSVEVLLGRYGLNLVVQPLHEPITGSFWGDPEAGVVGRTVFVRDDTPLHSLLHEACHIICMDEERRRGLERDAGGDDLEESAVCFLQILLADEIDGVGQARLMADMDAWGYSFRLGSTRAWFESDAEDARSFLLKHGLIDVTGAPGWRLRS